MKYATSGEGEEFEPLFIQTMIECFNDNKESGPHSTEGWVLSHILNYCHKNHIAFTLVSIPHKGYYVKRGIVSGVIPPEMLESFEHMP